MIIADASVWIDYFNGLDSRETDALDHALQDGVVAIGDIIPLLFSDHNFISFVQHLGPQSALSGC
ncbi:MAG: hypothetical protein HWE20_05395 [Gammaproteobacteria bacterium]|nr:hypothetical protein [Gammaproteobacteria bacterium]